MDIEKKLGQNFMLKNSKQKYWKLIPILIFTFFLLIYVILELSGLLTVEDVKEILNQSGSYSGLIIIGLLTSDLVLPIPSSVVMTFSGLFYGFLAGALISTIGSLTGSITGFIIFRKKGQSFTKKLIDMDEQKSMNNWFNSYGEGILIISRMIPMLAETMACFAGLTKISFKRFLLFIAVGTIPISLYYSYFGSHLKTVSEWSLPLAIGIIIPGIIWIILKKKI